MAREFSKKVRAEAFLRCGGKCQTCGSVLKVGEGEYDHIVPYALSEDSTLSNCQVLCVPCHRGEGAKTSDDIKAISKAKRNWLKHTGAWPKSKSKIKSRGFPKSREALNARERT
ncbi:HNH endonuclease [Sinorhizobium medicae]|uniref:HNH nuclease n=1 Tax=Sinorhizobium meliloti (strain SM11) TaxID=707241 RepID=F7X4A1_SINMM|nr:MULTISPECIES: HNH endonuclease signature motif containing protein [Sinorhizobium]AEH79687.1 HNH nuclease [Sinorhizobium meliloti SM11]MDE4557451.1 HNH endonuclease [Sinorhizobium meliloti SM11]MDX0889630.1 HNH endonuclease [Sinorhizobium medicae]MDX1194686.1 HNH endonuclease [Sinorhizobium medicae]MDX1237160.1 HNH endonuclease [Sinorhizobium medicae]